MFITPERAGRVRFSEPVFHVGQGLLVAPGNPLGLHSYQGAVDEGGRVAVLTGSVEEALLKRMGLALPLLIPTPDAQTGRAAVEAGLADALALSSPSLRWMSIQEPLVRCRMAWPFEQPDPALTGPMGYGAFAFRPGEEALARAFDRAIRDILPGPEYRGPGPPVRGSRTWTRPGTRPPGRSCPDEESHGLRPGPPCAAASSIAAWRPGARCAWPCSSAPPSPGCTCCTSTSWTAPSGTWRTCAWPGWTCPRAFWP